MKKAFFSTLTEYEKWLAENKEKVLAYVKEHDVPVKDLPVSARTYNALRINGVEGIGDILFLSQEELQATVMAMTDSVLELSTLKRRFLYDLQEELLDYVTSVTDASDDTVPTEETVVENTELPSDDTAEVTSSTVDNLRSWVGALLSRYDIKRRIFEFVAKQQIQILNCISLIF